VASTKSNNSTACLVKGVAYDWQTFVQASTQPQSTSSSANDQSKNVQIAITAFPAPNASQSENTTNHASASGTQDVGESPAWFRQLMSSKMHSQHSTSNSNLNDSASSRANQNKSDDSIVQLIQSLKEKLYIPERNNSKLSKQEFRQKLINLLQHDQLFVQELYSHYEQNFSNPNK
jgi:hypothetical protein